MSYKSIFLLISIILFLSVNIKSAYSSSESLKNEQSQPPLRYLEDVDIDEDGTRYNCSDKEKCNLDNMNCTNDTRVECNCKEGFTTIKGDNNNKYCSIERKKQLTAFLLELFVGFGAGHFYRHHYLMASLKLVAFVIGIYIICLFPLTAKCVTDCCDSDCLVVFISILFYIYAAGLATWYIFDLVYFGKNNYRDCSHDEGCIELMPW